MSAIIRVNRWYDQLAEPWRFVLFMVGVNLPIVAVQTWLPVTALAIALALIGMRVWWLKIGSRR